MTANPMTQRLQEWGAVWTPVNAPPGSPYWKIVSADGPVDIGQNHHVYLEVLGVDGQRAVGVPVEFYWNDGHDIRPTEEKRGEQFAMSFPLYAGGNAYGIRVADGLPSESIYGFGMGSFVPHHSFRVLFRRTFAAAASEPVVMPDGPTPPPAPPNVLRLTEEALRDAVLADALVAVAREMLHDGDPALRWAEWVERNLGDLGNAALTLGVQQGPDYVRRLRAAVLASG